MFGLFVPSGISRLHQNENAEPRAGDFTLHPLGKWPKELEEEYNLLPQLHPSLLRS
jgi:hypothetical protein